LLSILFHYLRSKLGANPKGAKDVAIGRVLEKKNVHKREVELHIDAF